MANLGFSDIIVYTHSFSATPSGQATLGYYVQPINGLTANHVLLNDCLPSELYEDAQWKTEVYINNYGDGRCLLTFSKPVRWDAFTATFYFGIPE